MIEFRYGEFSQSQIDEFKKELHKDLFWLILYKDPKTCRQYEEVNIHKYIIFLIKKLNGLNSLLFYPEEIVEIVSLLKAAQLELNKENFNWKDYRKLILDSQSYVDKIGGSHVINK